MKDRVESLLSRRQVLKYGTAGMTALIVGPAIPSIMNNPAFAHVQVATLNLTITDAIKEMVTHEPGNNEATCYFWCFKDAAQALPDCPGPNIFATHGTVVTVTITNELDEPHAFFIRGMVNSGPIAPGQTKTLRFRANRSGSHLYYDNLNAPVNRVMGLHGALIVMPRHGRRTPYMNPTSAVRRLFLDFGTKPWWPGRAWDEGGPNPDRPDGSPAHDSHPFRQWVWVLHEASPKLFAEVGSLPPGEIYSAQEFVDKYNNGPFVPTSNDGRANTPQTEEISYHPQYFTIGGQSGHFSHNFPEFCPNAYAGEPSVVRVLNAGLQTHSCHIHANHVYVSAINTRVQRNLLWLDTFTANPLDTFDWVVPFQRPPDIPNTGGIGMPDAPMQTAGGGTTWPPAEEMEIEVPGAGTMALDPQGNPVDLAVMMSPLCFPMHAHTENSQTAQGGNYNLGMISGIVFLGDHTTEGAPATFPGHFPG